MRKKVMLMVISLLGLAVGQSNRSLSSYGCTDIRHDYNGATYSTRVCIVYDPNMDKHFIVASGTGGGVSVIEEK